ncbi:growth arrest and DNA damage-inducible proteins-interacting protein 1 [Odontomachus brunneus]|uniref:growth arrest and DNA damage-inducible proteins-interacting protein 1 n=1 Tax=Odontomachus brunneus TaxID=486640 RepID=UPI0013F1AABC|nr:growth arrest and DNA damage-inducible proteins-interacting protein 1 [Odontomachus brunneus]
MRLRQICNVVSHRSVGFQIVCARRFFATESTKSKDEVVDITSADEKPIFDKVDNEQLREEIARKRNKSRLNQSHRNILMDLRPYDTAHDWYHNTVKYKKRILGRYGLKAIDEPAGFVWPTMEEVEDAQEYERVMFPLSLQERWKEIEEARKQKAVQMMKRENEILAKLAKMDQWTAELNAKIEKKKTDMQNARIRKERLVEEVRRHFGFNISPYDNRFKEMLEQKEKEEKKKKKEAKKKARSDRLALMVHKQVQEFGEETTKKEDDQDSKKSTE